MTNARQPIFSAGQSDARAVASQILLLHRQRLTAAELAHVRRVANGHDAGPMMLASLEALRLRAAARRPAKSSYRRAA